MDYFCPNDGSFMRTATMATPEGTTLVFQCRCGYYKEATDRDSKVYSRDYTNAPLVEQIKNNRYFLLDPTLPCVTDIVCANPDCLTRLNETSGLIIFSHGNADLSDAELASAVEGLPGYRRHYRIGLERVAVSIKGTLPEACKIGGRLIEAEPYKKPEQKSIMIKYDNANMKYLYICCCCGHNRE